MISRIIAFTGRRRRSTLGVGLAGVLLLGLNLGCAAVLGPGNVAFERRAWSPAPGFGGAELLTPHYRIRTTLRDDGLIEMLPNFMEGCLSAYRELLPAPDERREPMTSYVFATRAQWEAFTRQFAPRQASTYLHIREGAYLDEPRATTVAYDLGPDRTLALLAHEGFHQYLAGWFPRRVVPWLNEGLACQWESFELSGGRPRFTPERNHFRRNNLRAALQDRAAWIPLSHLLDMDAGEAVVRTGATTSSFYAEVWALTLYLRSHASRADRRGFRRLLDDAGTARMDTALSAYRATGGLEPLPPGRLIFQAYITDDLQGFERRFADFAHALVGFDAPASR